MARQRQRRELCLLYMLSLTCCVLFSNNASASFSPCTPAVSPTKAPDPDFVHFVTPHLGPVTGIAFHEPTHSTPHVGLMSVSRPLRINYTLLPTDKAGISPAHAHLLDPAAQPFKLFPTETLGTSTKNCH